MKRSTSFLIAFALLITLTGPAIGATFTDEPEFDPHILEYSIGTGPGLAPGQLTEPVDILFSYGNGNLYVVDVQNNRVDQFTTDGVYLSSIGRMDGAASPVPGEFDAPAAIERHAPTGDYWVVDSGNSRVQVFDSAGIFLMMFGAPGSGPGEFNQPRGIAYQEALDQFFVVDSGNNRVQVFDPSGVFVYEFGSPGGVASPVPGEFDQPFGIGVDLPTGDILVTEFGNDRVQRFDPFGGFVLAFGSPGSGDGQLNDPTAVAWNNNGLWVADTGNSRITRWSSTGLGGSEHIKPSGVGAFNGNMAMDFIGNVTMFVANAGNSQVERFERINDVLFNSVAVDPSGTLHLATYSSYQGDLVYGIKPPNEGWGFEFVDRVGDVGQYCSLVLDASNNVHISYFDADLSSLKYATGTTGSWTIETVRDGAGIFGQYSSIALSTGGRPAIAYTDEVGETLEYSLSSGPGAWVHASLGGAGIAYVSLQFDSADHPHIGYLDYRQTDPDEIRYQTDLGAGWVTETVDFTGVLAGIGHVSLALDAQDRPRMSYQIIDELRYAEKLGDATWQIETVDNGSANDTGQFSSLVLDPFDDSPRIAYMADDSDFYEVRFAARYPRGWQLQTVDALSLSGGPLHTALALSREGNPRIVYDGIRLGVAVGNLLAAQAVSPNVVRVNELETITLRGSSVGENPLLLELQHQGLPFVLTPSNIATTGPTVLFIEFDFAGAMLGSYHLVIGNSAGIDTLFDAVVVHDDPSDLRRITTQPSQERMAAATRPGVIPERVAFVSSREGSGGIFTKDPAEPFDLNSAVRIGALSAVQSCSWSPDADSLVCDTNSNQLYLVDVATGDFAPIVGADSSLAPQWSPVDDRVVYSKLNPAGGIGVQVIDTGTLAVSQITNPVGTEAHWWVEWSPDGQRIAYASRPALTIPADDIYTIPADGSGSPTLIVSSADTSNGFPTWSPDGQWIAFNSSRSGNSDIWIANSNGEQYGLFQITNDPAPDSEPSWSPDGSTLYFTSVRGAISDIYAATNLPSSVDTDGDLVPDLVDACPLEAPGLGEVDRDFDGCADATGSFRQVRFWAEDLLPTFYQTDALGDSTITDGSDFTEMNVAFGDWSSGALSGIVFGGGDDLTRGGPADATSGDGINNVSFRDPDGFDYGTIAITYSSVATGDTTINGRWYRPGEIVDADVLFNSFYYSFQTPSSPKTGAFDVGTVAVHEFGHLAGFAHSTCTSSTMFSVVFRGTDQRTLEDDDVTLGLRAYSDPGGLPLALGVEGRVLRGEDGVTPVVGAAVMAIDEATGDTSQVTYTGMDGVYRFYPPLPTDIRIWIHPLDGTPGVNGTIPAYVGQDFALVAEDDFLPEYYDGPLETNSDFGAAGVVVNPGLFFGADILTNPDLQPPVVVTTSPAQGETAAPANGAVMVKFDEKIVLESVSNSTFSLFETLPPNTSVGGVAALLKYDSLLVFTPDVPLDWSTQYTMYIGSGIEDEFGNPMPDTTQVSFTVRVQPPLEVTGVSPAAVPEGATLVISGTGFDNGNPTQNTVTFLGAGTVPSFAATLEEVFVTVPTGAESGSLQVTVGSIPSNWFPITIAQPKGIPVGTSLGTASLGANPRRVIIGPMGEYAYVATNAGVSAVNSNPGDVGFLTDIANISLAGGSKGVVSMPDGKRVLAISSSPPELNVIDAEPGSPFQNQIDVTETVPLDAEPLGIAVVPGGAHVVIAYADRVIRHVSGDNPEFGLPVQEWTQTGTQFLGPLAVSADLGEVYAIKSDGSIAVLSFDPSEGTDGFVTSLSSGTDPRGVAGTPDGQRMLSVDQSAIIREYDARGPQTDSHIESGGYNGISVSPEGTYAYAANLILNKIDVYALTSSVSLATAIPTGVDPQDVTTGFSGRYVYVVTDGPDALEVFDTEVGPAIEIVSPISGGDGTKIALIGSGFDPSLSTVSIGGIAALPDTVSPDSSFMVVTQPAGADDSGISVMTGTQSSNTRPYRVVNRPDEGNLSVGAVTQTGTTETMSLVMMSPTEEYLITTYQDGTVIVLGGDPYAPNFLLPVQTIVPATTGLPVVSTPDTHGLAMTPDGRKLFTPGATSGVNVWDVAPSGAADPVTFSAAVTDGGGPLVGVSNNMVLTPDGKRLFAVDVTSSTLYEIDAEADTVTNSFTVNVDYPGAMAVHPDGNRLFLGNFELVTLNTFAEVWVLDIDPDSPTYGTELAAVGMPIGTPSGAPSQLVPSRDGSMLYVLTSEVQGVSEGWDVQFMIIDPTDLNYLTVAASSSVSLDNKPTLVPNHSGTMLFWVTPNSGEVQAMSSGGVMVGSTGFTVQLAASYSLAISADDARVYAPGFGDNLLVVDVSTASSISMFSGTGQVGVANQPLASPIVAQITGPSPALAEGSVVLFQATPQSGTFSTGNQSLLTAVDANGFALATYIAGAVPQQDTVSVSAVPGVLATFVTVVGDTASQPPQIVSVRPVANDTPGVNTKVAIDFSKAVNTATLPGNILLRESPAGTIIAGVIATATSGTRAVMSPSSPLDYATTYEFEVTGGVEDYNTNAVSNPGIFPFSTDGAPAGVTLNSISPTSGIAGNTVVVAGEGFSATLAENTVYFNGSPASPTSGDPGALTLSIPGAATTGGVYVIVDDGTPDTSNVIPFTVLAPVNNPVTEEIALVSVPSSGQQIAALPNGTYAYMTSAGSNTVVPVNVPLEVSEAAISVGLSPFAVVAAPASDRVYCSNFLSNTVSVIDADTASANFNSVVNTIATGNGPTGLAVHPDGRTLYVLNYSDSTLDFIDTDALSATFGLARKSITTNSTSKSMTVTPDGALVVVGTSVGLLVLDSSDGSARRSITTNSTSKSMTVTPDGAAVIVLTEDNQLLLINLFAADGENPELARKSITTNSTSKSMTVSPDGAFVYVTTEDNNVLVFALVTIGGGGAAEKATFLGFQLVATVEVGENPFGMAVVLETGTLLVVNEGDGTVTFINISDITVGELVVELDMSPNTLNLGSNGNFISAAIEFPAFLDPFDLDLESVLLNGVLPADTSQGIVLTDNDLDDILEAEVKFSRQDVIDILPEGQMVEIVITGLHKTRAFAGTDSIRIKRPKIKKPQAGQAVPPNAETEITWEMIQDGPADHVDIYVSTDLGETWDVVAVDTDDDEAHTWMVPDVESEQALLMIVSEDKRDRILGYDIMNEPFRIGAVVTGVEEVIPARFALLPASPNPFRANANIRFDLPEPTAVTLRLFAIDGSVVRTFASGQQYPAGRHAFAWDGKNDSGRPTGAGVYFMKIQAGDHQEAVQKIVRLSR